MADPSDQNLSDTNRSLDVSEIIREVDLKKSCRILSTNFEQIIHAVRTQILNNVDNECNRAEAVNPNLSTMEAIRQKNSLRKMLTDLLNSFVMECIFKKNLIISYLPEISQSRRNYISKLTSYNEALREFTLNETEEARITLNQLKVYKDLSKESYISLLTEHNRKVQDLLLQLDNFKQGFITIQDPTSGQESIKLFSETVDNIRNFCIFPDETAEQKLARDREFYSWKEMLRLPSNWLVDIPTFESELSEFESFDPMATGVPSYVDPSIPSTSGLQRSIPPSFSRRKSTPSSSDSSSIHVFSPPTVEEISVPPSSVQPSLSPTLSTRVDVFVQSLPEVSQSLDVCQVLEGTDVIESCRSLVKNFEENLTNAVIQLAKNLENEWRSAVAVNPNLSMPEVLRQKNILEKSLLICLEHFLRRCSIKKSTVIKYLPEISQVRQAYISKLTLFNEALREIILNDTDETRMTIAQLEREKDFLRRKHNELLIDYNHRVLDLQLQLDNFKQGIVTLQDLTSRQESIELFYKYVDGIRNFCIFPDETAEQKLARDREFYSWKEMLRLPSNWLVEVRTPQPEVPKSEGFEPTATGVSSYVDPSSIPSTSSVQQIVPPSFSEREFNVPSPGLSQVLIPSPSRLDEIPVPLPSVQPPRVVPSPTSSSLGSDEFRPKSTIGDTPLHRKHIDNEHLIRRIKRTYWKVRREVDFYTGSDPFTRELQRIHELNDTVQGLSREWKTIQGNVQDDSTRRDRERDETRDESRDEERIERPRAERTSIKSVEQLYNEWIEAKNNLQTYAAGINDDWDKIIELQRSLETLYEEIERNDDDEQLLAAEDTINRELILLRRKIGQVRPEIMRLKNIVSEKKTALSDKVQTLYVNLLRKKARLEGRIARSEISRG